MVGVRWDIGRSRARCVILVEADDALAIAEQIDA